MTSYFGVNVALSAILGRKDSVKLLVISVALLVTGSVAWSVSANFGGFDIRGVSV